MIRTAILVLAGGLGLLVLAAGLRGRPEGRRRRPERPASLRAAERQETPFPTPVAPNVGAFSPRDRRSQALRRTVETLRLGPAEADAFLSVARTVLGRLDAAWQIREARVLSVSGNLAPEEWDARHREAQAEYERSKDEALAMLFGLMAERREYQPLRLRVESWLDEVR